MIEFRVLGSLEAVDEGQPVALGGPQQRALLAVLLLHRGTRVSADALIDALWGEAAPPSAPKLVQGYVSALRRALGDGLLFTHDGGYELRARADVDAFTALALEGRRALVDGDAATASARLHAALELWRGPPLADFAYEPWAQGEVAQLEEAHLAALEDRIDADLALGEDARLVGELDALVGEHPLYERLVGQLMLALYRSGRQADALAAYRAARGRLVEELGLEPGRELQELQRAMLAQEPALDRPAHRRVPLQLTRPRPVPLAAAAGAFLLAGLILVAVRLGDSPARTLLVAPNSLAAIDAHTDRIVGTVAVGTRPGAIAVSADSLWVANRGDQTVSRIDARTLRARRTIPVRGPPTGLAASPSGIWVVESDLNPDASAAASASVLVGRLDPQFDTLGASVRIGNVAPNGPGAIAAEGRSVWVAPSTGLLTRLDAATGGVTRRLDPNATPSGVAVGAGAVWLTDAEAGDVVRVDPSGLLTPIPVGDGPAGIAVGSGAVWVTDTAAGTLVRIDPSTRAVRDTIPVGPSPAGVAVGAGFVWVAGSGDGTISRIDPATDRVRARIVVGGSPQAVAVAGARVWITVDAPSPAPTGGRTLRMVTSDDIDVLDPALAYDTVSDQLVAATCAGLVYQPDGAGSQPAPDVALPSRSAGGRTYRFRIRPGFRFSPPSGAPVTADTFKATIERTLSPRIHSPLAAHLADVAGARAYMAGRARHIAGVIARGDTLIIRLRAPAPDLLARLAEPAFCAVPPNTPIVGDGVPAVPGAGRYYAASVTPHQDVVLLRNPNYPGARPRRFARIQVAAHVPARRAVAEIAAGRADYMRLGSDPGTAAIAARLGARYGDGSTAAAHGGQRYFVGPSLQVDAFYLNTHRPLFRDVRMRKAVNAALDRRALAAIGGGFQTRPAVPSDHYLPPGMAGYRAARVYPDTPDLTRARALVQGRTGRTAVLYTCNVNGCPEQAQIVKTDLAAIGLRVEIHTFPQATLFAREARPGEPFDLAYEGWLPDYLDPSAMLEPLLHDASIGPTFDDPVWQRRLAAAARLSGPRRYLAYGRLDLDLARHAAPLAAIGNESEPDFFAARIGCQTYGPYGMDLAALCLRR